MAINMSDPVDRVARRLQQSGWGQDLPEPVAKALAEEVIEAYQTVEPPQPVWPTYDAAVAFVEHLKRVSATGNELDPGNVRDALRGALLDDPIVKAAITWASQPVVRSNIRLTEADKGWTYAEDLLAIFRAVSDAGLIAFDEPTRRTDHGQ